MMDGTQRKDIRPGLRVRVVQKPHQRSGQLTEGTVKDILTKSAVHPHGIKVRLTDGIIGRVKEIAEERKGLQERKHSCPDCTFCQFCSDARCGMCRPDRHGGKDKKKKEHKPLFRNY
ncbi:MAG TPA: YwbE family protein [Dissulfurispiraceae bacterium]